MLLRLGLIAIALILQSHTSATGIGSSQSAQQPATAQQQPPATDQRGTKAAPVVVHIEPPTDSERKADQAARQKEGEPTTNWWIVWLTGFMLLVAGVQAGFFWWQLRMMRVSMIDARAAATAAQSAAIAAQESLALSKDTAERQLRAYVSIETSIVNRDETMDEEMFLGFTATVTNRGQTPGYHLRAKSEARVLSAPFPSNTELKLEASVGLLAPQAEFKLWTDEDCHIDAEDAPVLKRSTEKRLYFYGIVTYEDEFRKQWRQRFCYHAHWDAVTDELSLTLEDVWNDEMSIGGQPTPKEGGH